MASLTTGRVVGGVGGLAALAFGGYYVTQSSEVSALRREQQGLETKVFVLRGKARGAESSILETESLIKALSKQTELGKQAEQEIAALLEAARSEVQRLEAQQEQQVRRRALSSVRRQAGAQAWPAFRAMRHPSPPPPRPPCTPVPVRHPHARSPTRP